jgi:hypothetical protein
VRDRLRDVPGALALERDLQRRVRVHVQEAATTSAETGTEKIIYGGTARAGDLGDGARYNPTLDDWTPIPEFTPGRSGHSTVWNRSRDDRVGRRERQEPDAKRRALRALASEASIPEG